ncbi:amidohydrolase family protein, partial [Vibrio cyclitrophicus]
WATSGSARAMGRTDIGTLEVGKQADLAMFKLDDIRFSGSQDPLAALLLCGAQQADKVMVAGKWRVNDGAVIGVDMEQLMHRHHSAAMKLGKLAMNNN